MANEKGKQKEAKGFKANKGTSNRPNSSTADPKDFTGSRKDNQVSKGKEVTFKTQDREWYYPNEVVGEATGSFPYNRPTGIKVGLAPSGVSTAMDTMPSVMRINYAANYGSFKEETAAVNIAARAMFAYVRKRNRGGVNYESADLMTYFMAVDQIVTMMAELKRDLSAVSRYELMNRTFPAALASACGFDVQDASKNFAAYVARFNILVDKFNRQFAVPKSFNLFRRRDYLASNIFIDGTSIRSQLYVFKLAGYYAWTGTIEGGSSLTWTAFPSSTTQTLDKIITDLDTAMSNLIAEQDIAIMCGDIVNAYENAEIFQMAPYQFGQSIEPVYNPDLLQQVENLTYFAASVGNILQNNNVLSCNHTVTITDSNMAAFINSNYPLNSYLDKPTWKDNLEFSRLITVVGPEYDVSSNKYTLHCGSELCTSVYLYYADSNDGSIELAVSPVTNWYEKWDFVTSSSSPSTLVAQLQFDSLLENFDWHPWRRRIAIGGTQSVPSAQYAGTAFDSKVTAFLSNSDIIGTHDCAILALLDISMLTVKA